MSPRPDALRRALPRTVVPAAASQLVALLAVAAMGAGALTATSTAAPIRTMAAGAVLPAAAAGPITAADRLPATTAAPGRPAGAAARPAPKARPTTVTAKHAAPAAQHAAPAARWLPSGTGMWIYEWRRTNRGKPRSVVAQARRSGLSTLYVRTGSSHDGFTGTHVLRTLLPATAGKGVHVVAWDFPELDHPVRDARRLARAAWFARSGRGPVVAAVAPDIETRAEGTRSTPARVRMYMVALRRALPKDVAILATVPWPSRARRGHFPYASVARQADALLPMAYWYDNPPALVTKRSMAYLHRFHRPVQPVGQGYDGRIDVPSLPHNNLRRQVPAFLHTAHRLGAGAVSVWSWQSAPRATWHALRNARRLFPTQR